MALCTDGGAHMMRAAQDVGQAMPLPDVLYNLNRGVDKLRFLRPVPVGSRLRARVRLAGVELLPALEGATTVTSSTPPTRLNACRALARTTAPSYYQPTIGLRDR